MFLENCSAENLRSGRFFEERDAQLVKFRGFFGEKYLTDVTVSLDAVAEKFVAIVIVNVGLIRASTAECPSFVASFHRVGERSTMFMSCRNRVICDHRQTVFAILSFARIDVDVVLWTVLLSTCNQEVDYDKNSYALIPSSPQTL